MTNPVMKTGIRTRITDNMTLITASSLLERIFADAGLTRPKMIPKINPENIARSFSIHFGKEKFHKGNNEVSPEGKLIDKSKL